MTEEEFGQFYQFLDDAHHDLDGLIAIRKLRFLKTFPAANSEVKRAWDMYCEKLSNASTTYLHLIGKYEETKC